jgi:mandelate racemase
MVEREALAPAAVEQNLAKRFRLLGTQGLVGMALAGIDMVLWDALARAYNLSLVSLLGGSARPVPAYGAVGYGGETESAKVAEDWVRRGLTGIKAKIGYATVAEDLAVIRAMRSAVGRDVAIMVDYNQSLTPADAVERLRRVEDEGLTWIEEPTLAHDYQGHAHIAHEIRTPFSAAKTGGVCATCSTPSKRAPSDYMMPDVMKIGGVTGWMRAAALGETHGIRLSNHHAHVRRRRLGEEVV